MNSDASRNAPMRFCMLLYSGQSDQSQLDLAKVVAILTAPAEGEPAIRVHREWGKIVPPRDQDYVESLYLDFKERAKSDPEALFRQLSDLSVGPLITYDAGANLAEHPAYLSLMESFQEF